MSGRPGVIGMIRATALLLTAFVATAPAPAQGTNAQQKTPGTPAHPPWVYWVKKELPPPTWQEKVLFHPLTWVIAAGSVLAGLAAQLYFRLTATTDPAKLAASDPWFQAQLARHNPGPTRDVPTEPKGRID